MRPLVDFADPQVCVGFLRDRARRSDKEGIAYIDANRDRFGVESICCALQFAPRTYYAARARPVSKRALRDEVLKPEISLLVSGNDQLMLIARQTRSGVSGSSMCRTPRSERASMTAFCTAGADPIVPDSPMPFAPRGLSGVGVS